MTRRRPLNLVLIVAIALIFPFPTNASDESSEGTAHRSIEYGLLGSIGKIDSETPAPALRLGFSGSGTYSINSSLELGFLNRAERRYGRLNLLGFGPQPELTGGAVSPLGSPSGYVRLELFSMLWAEGGHFAYTPGAEFGYAFRFAGSWALQLGARFSYDTSRPSDSLTSVVLGLTQIRR